MLAYSCEFRNIINQPYGKLVAVIEIDIWLKCWLILVVINIDIMTIYYSNPETIEICDLSICMGFISLVLLLE